MHEAIAAASGPRDHDHMKLRVLTSFTQIFWKKKSSPPPPPPPPPPHPPTHPPTPTTHTHTPHTHHLTPLPPPFPPHTHHPHPPILLVSRSFVCLPPPFFSVALSPLPFPPGLGLGLGLGLAHPPTTSFSLSKFLSWNILSCLARPPTHHVSLSFAKF